MQNQESTYEKSDVVECVGFTNAFYGIADHISERGLGRRSDDPKIIMVIESTGRIENGMPVVNSRFFIGASMEDVSRELMPL